MLRCDLHLHTKEDKIDSKWIEYNAKELIDKAAELNFDVLSFTCHNQVFYSDEIVEYAKSKNILLIPGTELTLEGKHVLVYGNFDINEIRNLSDLRKLKDKDDCLVVAAHPYFKDKSCLGNKLIENIDLFDAIEYCHFYNHLFNWNKKAVNVAKKYGKSLIGNSDCHIMPLQFNKTYSMIDSEKDMKSIFRSIKENKIIVVSEPLPLRNLIEIFAMRFFRKV
ncbi:MAG: PHP domain-containing protein [Candidatus Woesearchaeota archaeon]